MFEGTSSPSPRFCVTTGLVAIIFAVCCNPTHAQPPRNRDQEPDDSLGREDKKLVEELTRRGMPELVEELLSSAPTWHRIHIARAYAQAAAKTKEPDVRDRFLEKAAAEYRRVIALRREPGWVRGLRRPFDIAAWEVEWADVLLRCKAAPELDRYEVTSSLDFDRRRIVKILREANELYVEAGGRLDEMSVGLRTQEQQYLLLGLADRIVRLAEQRQLNGAWAALYLAIVEDEKPRRQSLLDTTLVEFDTISRTAKDADRKYNALLGAGIALREGGRSAEAMSAFDRIRLSTAPAAIIVRARHEQARTHLAARQFDEARREWGELEQLSVDGPEDASAFYIRLAPVMKAYCYLLESQWFARAEAQRAVLRDKAISAFNEIASRGGPWPEIAQVYIASLQGPPRKLKDLGDAELSSIAARSMKEGKYDKAIEPLEVLLARPPAKSRSETAFNLAVCQFQTGDLAAAAEGFESIANSSSADESAERAATYAYQCRRQLANTDKSPEIFKRLAEAASRLADRYPSNNLADEARWVAALAFQEIRQWTRAIEAHSKILRASTHYRSAQREIAVCRQRLYEEIPAGAPAERRRQAARLAVDSWRKYAADTNTNTTSRPSEQERRLGEEASIAAATILASRDLSQFKEALSILRTLPQSDAVVVLRLRCLQGMGDEQVARKEFEELMNQAPDAQRGRILAALAEQLQTEARRLQDSGRSDDAKNIFAQTVGVYRNLLDWLNTQPESADQIAAVRSNLAQALAQSGDLQGARSEYDQLIAADPKNGEYLYKAAQSEEVAARSTNPTDAAAADRAESYWARLLEDGALLDRAPAVYWEARYYWLSHQLRHGRAGDVWKGIESEKAWYPDLGGPPWQGRLMELAQMARDAGPQQNSR
jgi:tetratricopeptide (TPR) repeat protein